MRVTRTFPGSAAARASVRVGDIIVSVDGKDTRSMRELRAVIGAKRVGERVVLRIRRNGEYLSPRWQPPSCAVSKWSIRSSAWTS